MSEIICLDCGEVLDIPEYVCIDNYDGEFLCNKCGARLAIKFVGCTKPVKYSLKEHSAEDKDLLPVDMVLEFRKMMDKMDKEKGAQKGT